MRVVTVVGARPQFIKAWPVSRALRAGGIEESLIHSGQHYDDAMSRVFFEELELPRPERDLGVGSGSHAEQTAGMLVPLERAFTELAPDWVLVYGDTNTTLAGALAAAKLRIPLAHVEAGLRSWNRAMPEEVNRVLTDHCADLLLCPTRVAVENLAREGVSRGVHLVGDVMFDAVQHFGEVARARSRVLDTLGVVEGEYFLATVHRAASTDDPITLRSLVAALAQLEAPVVFPVHPRTRARLAALPQAEHLTRGGRLMLTSPVGYLDMLRLEQSARAILTDSGGVQKEAFFFGVPCVTLRAETEWVETVECGWNVLAGSDPEAIVRAALSAQRPSARPPALFGDGDAAGRIAALLHQAGQA